MVRARTVAWSWAGHPVTVAVDGAGEGPAVLLLPALSSISTRRELAPLLRGLAGEWTAIAVDWPGFGDRARPSVSWTPDALSAFLGHLVEHALPPLRATVAAGHAAAYALYYAARYPGRLGSLVLLAPTWRGPLPTMAGGDRPLFKAIRRAVELPIAGPLLYQLNVNPAMVRMMAAGHAYSDRATLTASWWAEKRDVFGARGARFASAGFVTGGLDRMQSRAAFLDAARSVSVPILQVYGAETPRKSRAEMDALAELPNVRTVVFPRGKLGFYEEFGREVAPIVMDFLSTNAPRV